MDIPYDPVWKIIIKFTVQASCLDGFFLSKYDFTPKIGDFTPKKWQVFLFLHFTQKKWQVFLLNLIFSLV